MSACPSLNFSCTNISCSIWFCCGGGGGSNKEHEREQQNQKQPAVPINNPQPSPPLPQVIKIPDHLREPSTTTYVEKPAAPQPPPLPSYSCTPPIAETAPSPRREPPTDTYYPPRTQPPPPPQPPSTTQQQATRPPTLQTPTLPALPPKVYGSWTQTTPHTHPVPPVPVWSSQTQTPSSAPILPPSLESPPNKPVLHDMQRHPHMQMIPASHGQSETVHKPPPAQPPRPGRQPSKTYHQTMPATVDQLHPAYSGLPSENYYYDYDEAALPDVVPPRAALPQGDSRQYVGFYAQERAGSNYLCKEPTKSNVTSYFPSE